MKNVIKQSELIRKSLFKLLISPHFLAMTIIGNGTICLFAFVVWKFEIEAHGNMKTYLDALWWSYSTATTVGYGDIIPVTTYGRMIGILLMLLGTGLFATYTALVAQAVIGKPFDQIKMLEQRDITTNEKLFNIKKQLSLIQEHLEGLEENDSKKE